MVRRIVLSLAAVGCAHGAAPTMTIGPTGAAGITAATPMNRGAIAAAAPGYRVDEGETASGERVFTRFALSMNGELVFSVYPAPDRSGPVGIGTRSALARGPNGEVIGLTLFRDTVGIDRTSCRSAMPHERFTFSCADATGRFWRAYQAPASYDGPHDMFAVLPVDVADVAVLAQMYWVAPSAAADG